MCRSATDRWSAPCSSFLIDTYAGQQSMLNALGGEDGPFVASYKVIRSRAVRSDGALDEAQCQALASA